MMTVRYNQFKVVREADEYAYTSLEQRLSAVEFEVAAMRHSISTLETDLDKLPWWEEISGSFANNEAYDGAMRLGREYRESSRPAAV